MFKWIKRFFGFAPTETKQTPPSESRKSANQISRLDSRRAEAVAAKKEMKATATDWFRINPASERASKNIPVFVRYKYSETVTLKMLKEERERKKRERIAALEREVTSKLDETVSLISKGRLEKTEDKARTFHEKAEIILQNVGTLIHRTKNSTLLERYKKLTADLQTLREILERKRLQRLAEEKRRRKEREKKEREEAERKRLEQEEKERKDKERREAETQRLAEQALEKERAEMAERERLQSLCSQIKTDANDIKELLMENGIRCFYHFTDKRNLQSIKRHGGLLSWHYCRTHDINIPCQGGDSDSERYDMRYGLEDFVRLSFCSDHPMAFRLKKKGCNLVLLKIRTDVAWFKNTMFSDINAADSLHSHGGELENLQNVDFRAVKRTFVSREDDDFKTHQAEVMVKTFVPIEYIMNIDNPQQI